MLASVRFCSLPRFVSLKPRADRAVVSILDGGERRRAPAMASGWGDVLSLTFEDCAEEDRRAAPWSWPDNPSPEEHAVLSITHLERVPSLADAEQIVAFLAKHLASGEQTHLLVHCQGGLSRSAAVAEFAVSTLGLPIIFTGRRSTQGCNARLLRLLEKAWASRNLD